MLAYLVKVGANSTRVRVERGRKIWYTFFVPTTLNKGKRMLAIETYMDQTQYALYTARTERSLFRLRSLSAMIKQIDSAESVEELTAFTLRYGLCDYCDYNGLNIKVVKMMVSSIVEVGFRFPRIRSRSCFLGSKTGFSNALIKLRDKDEETIQAFGLREICSDALIQDLAEEGLYLIDHTVYNGRANNILAQAFWLFGLLDAVVLDEADFSGLGYRKLKTALQENVSAGFHPLYCDDPKYVLYHEYGHILDFIYGISEDEEFLRFYHSMEEKEVEAELCRYALYNEREFFAEGFSEYMCATRPRALSSKIIDFLENKFKNTY